MRPVKGDRLMADQAYMKLSTEGSDIAVLTLDDPRGTRQRAVAAVLDELEKHLNDAGKRARIWPAW